MTHDQLEALEDLMRAIASEEAGRAVRQPRCREGVRHARRMAQLAFDLPITED